MKFIQTKGGLLNDKNVIESDGVCDICGKVTNVIVDGKTKEGPWAWMCVECHEKIGIGLGLGRGQSFVYHSR